MSAISQRASTFGPKILFPPSFRSFRSSAMSGVFSVTFVISPQQLHCSVKRAASGFSVSYPKYKSIRTTSCPFHFNALYTLFPEERETSRSVLVPPAKTTIFNSITSKIISHFLLYMTHLKYQEKELEKSAKPCNFLTIPV